MIKLSLWLTYSKYKDPRKKRKKTTTTKKLMCVSTTQQFKLFIIYSFYWHVQNATIPCCSQELLPFLSVNVLFPATLLHQLFFHPLSPHLAICFLVYLSILLFPNSCIIPFWEFYFLPFSVHTQTNVIYLTLSPFIIN